MENTSLLDKKNSTSSVSKRLGRSCVMSKSALLVLLWVFVSRLIHHLLYEPMTYQGLFFATYIPVFTYPICAIILLLYPVSGFLADVKFGRHKTIIWSLCVLFIVISSGITISIPFTALWFTSFQNIGQWGLIGIPALLFIPMTAALVGLNANIIQYGMDQLHDSPVDHQSLFIHWYVWVYYLSYFLSQLPWAIVSYQLLLSPNPFDFYSTDTSKTGMMVSFYVFAIATLIVLGITLPLSYYKNHWFLIYSLTIPINPYKLVFKVSKFAWKHKNPIRRSAFTYHEDELPTGLNLGKSKYGGPFTTEEVENVKAFYGILKILLTLGFAFILYTAVGPFQYFFVGHIYSEQYIFNGSAWEYNSHLNFAKILFFEHNLFSSFLISIILPVYLLLFRNSIQRYIPSMLKRTGIGIVLLILSVTCTLTMDTVAHVHVPASSFNETNCMFKFWFSSVYQDPTELIFQGFLDAAAFMLIDISLYEFICAQSPHSMKGFLIGLSFAVQGLSLAISAPMDWVIAIYYPVVSFPSCGMVYYLLSVVIGLLGLMLFAYTGKKYKYRERDEQCNYYRYAEDYYSKTQEEENV